MPQTARHDRDSRGRRGRLSARLDGRGPFPQPEAKPPFPLAKPCGRQLAPTLVKDRFKGRVQKSRPRSASRNCVIGGDNAGNADRDMR